MSDLSEFFLLSKPSVTYIEGIELTHSSFSQTYRFVRGTSVSSLVLTHEVGGPFSYAYLPMKIRPLASGTDLDQDIEITLGDVGDYIAQEIELISTANTFQEKPQAVYRCWRSDDLTLPIFGPVRLRIDAISLTREGSSFRAKAASYNIVRTGETYRIERFPMLAALA